jgi:cyanate permease
MSILETCSNFINILTSRIFVSSATVVQYAFFAFMVEKFGFRNSMIMSIWVFFLVMTFFPLSLRLNTGASPGELTPQAFIFLVAIITVMKTVGSSFSAALIVSMNRTIESKQRAAMNGFAQIIGSLARGLGPLLAGYLVFACYSHLPPRQGSLVLWFTLSGTGIICFVVLNFFTTDTLAERVLDEV